MFKKSKSSFKRFDKPTFYLRLDTSECKYDVKINGTFVEYNYGGRPHHIDYPINHWLRSGHNEIVIRMYEWPDDEAGYGVGTRKAPAKFSGRIKVKNSGEDISTASEICNVIYQDVLEPEKTGIGNSSEPGTFTLKESIEASAKGDIEISEIEKDVMESPRGIQVSRTFNLPVDLPEWGFFHGDDIPSLAEMTDEEFDKITAELFAETMKIHSALAAKNITDVLSMFKNRSAEIDAAFYLEAGTTQKELKEDFENQMNNPEMTLDAPRPGYAQLYVAENRKLAWLFAAGGLMPILRYSDGEALSVNYDLKFMKKDNRWIIAR